MQPQQQYPPQYPQQPQSYPAPQPAYPPQGYPQQPAPQYPPQPQGYPQPGYPQGYAQPQYAPPAPQGPPAQPMPAVSLDDYWQQPSSSGGPSLKFKDAMGNPQLGKSYEGFIARALSNNDVRPQTNNAGVPQFYRDGRPKSVMVVPLLMQPSQEFPDGQAGWWVKGQARDELARAMAEAGAPAGAPESGAYVRITLVNVRPIPNMSPAFQYRVDYTRPQGAAPAPQQSTSAPVQAQPPLGYMTPDGPVVTAEQPTAQPMPQYQPQTAPVMSTATGQPVVHQQPVPQPVQQAPMPQPMPQPAAAPAAAPAGFNPEQQALFAKLTGGQAAS